MLPEQELSQSFQTLIIACCTILITNLQNFGLTALIAIIIHPPSKRIIWSLNKMINIYVKSTRETYNQAYRSIDCLCIFSVKNCFSWVDTFCIGIHFVLLDVCSVSRYQRLAIYISHFLFYLITKVNVYFVLNVIIGA